MKDEFMGDNQKLMSCIGALLALDDSGSLSSPIGGHARKMLEAACIRIEGLMAENEFLRKEKDNA